tara:strand:- start:6195 stop:7358 length:1164 start_codon:yes stop_codon:yes gene_type:complete
MAKPIIIDELPYRHSVFLDYGLDLPNISYWWSDSCEDDFFNRLKKLNLFKQFAKDIITNDAYLIIDYSQDPINIKDFESSYKNSVFSFFKKYNVPWSKLIILSPSPDNLFFDQAGDNLVNFVKSDKVKRPYKHIHYNNLFQYTKRCYEDSDVFEKIDIIPSKHFLFMSFRDSIPRMLVNTFFHTNLLSDNFISHNRFTEQNKLTNVELFKLVQSIFETIDNFDYKSFLKYGFKKLTLDDPLNKSSATHSYDLHKFYSSKTCFEIVSETCVAHNKLCVTEKTFKSILSKNVFLLLGNPYSLNWLKSLGFQTFSDIIDENYDKEEIFYKRFLMLFNEVKKLCSLDVESLHKKLKPLNEIVEYNYNHFLNTTWDFNLSQNLHSHMDKHYG